MPVELPSNGHTETMTTDEGIRPNATYEAVAALQPAFNPDHSITAGNASQITDGAAGILLMSREKARELGLRPRARVLAQKVVGCDPVLMLEGPIPGTAAVLELARIFAERPPRRAILVAHFSGEELGLLGSQWFVEHAPVALDSIAAMVNFDMVGRLRDRRISVAGSESGSDLRALASEAAQKEGITVNLQGSPYGPSDHSKFYDAGVPVLFFYTGGHSDYHTPSDTADKIDAAGMARHPYGDAVPHTGGDGGVTAGAGNERPEQPPAEQAEHRGQHQQHEHRSNHESAGGLGTEAAGGRGDGDDEGEKREHHGGVAGHYGRCGPSDRRP